MENRIAVSVIVPAYNAEKVVENCIGSISKQSLKDIEIIAVDDGSKDSTRKVLEKLAEGDKLDHAYLLESRQEYTITYHDKPYVLNRIKLSKRDSKGIKPRI